MHLIGLTGGVGMGKTTASNFLQQRGLPVIDTDVLAREVVEPGLPAWDEIRRLFGEDITDSDGRLRRDELARQVFAEPARRQQLEAIIHPRIRERWVAQVALWRTEKHPAGVVVIPLLFETDAAGSFDSVICVACSASTQRQRLLARGWTSEQIAQRIAAQWPVEKKVGLADYVIWNESDLEVHAEQLDRILRFIL